MLKLDFCMPLWTLASAMPIARLLRRTWSSYFAQVVVLGAPKLVSLELKLAKDAFKVFEDTVTQLPSAVRRLEIGRAYHDSDPSPLYHMLARIDPLLEDFRVRVGHSYYDFEATNLRNFPTVAAKLTHAFFPVDDFIKTSWIPNSRIRELRLARMGSSFDRVTVKKQLSVLGGLESLHMIGADTSFWLDVVATLPKLKSILIGHPDLNLSSSGKTSSINTVFGRKGLKVAIEVSKRVDWSGEGLSEERTAWQQLFNAEWIVSRYW